MPTVIDLVVKNTGFSYYQQTAVVSLALL